MKEQGLRLTRLTNEQADSRARVLAHLRNLSNDDLMLRFGMARVKDELLVNYVRGLNLDRDIVLGFEQSTGEIAAIAHAARYEVTQSNRIDVRAEVSFSVTPHYRGHGLAKSLMRAIVEASVEAGIERLFAQCVAGNRPMRSVFARAGWNVEVDDGEVLAVLPLLPVVSAHA